MYSKLRIYGEVMSVVSNSGEANVHYRLTGGLVGFIKDVINVEVWETENAITFVTSDDSKITFPTEIIDLMCIMGDRS